MNKERIEELRSEISWMEEDLKALKEDLEALISEDASKTPEQKRQDTLDAFLYSCVSSGRYVETGFELPHHSILIVEDILRKHWDEKAKKKIVQHLKEIGKIG